MFCGVGNYLCRVVDEVFVLDEEDAAGALLRMVSALIDGDFPEVGSALERVWG